MGAGTRPAPTLPSRPPPALRAPHRPPARGRSAARAPPGSGARNLAAGVRPPCSPPAPWRGGAGPRRRPGDGAAVGRGPEDLGRGWGGAAPGSAAERARRAGQGRVGQSGAASQPQPLGVRPGGGEHRCLASLSLQREGERRVGTGVKICLVGACYPQRLWLVPQGAALTPEVAPAAITARS